MKPQILVSAATTGSGKTVFTMGLIRALQKRGLKIQPYKVGPEFIDSQLLSIASGNETVNLDAWMSSHTHVQYLYNKYGEKADICITEGVAALFDGYRRIQGSSAEMAKLLGVPVILLINARMAGYSIAPLIYGFKHFCTGVRIAGVVFNQISSAAHYAHLREACADAGVDCLGALPSTDAFKLPSKHTCWTQSSRQALEEQINQMAAYIEEHIDLNRLLNRCNRNFPCQYTLPYSSDVEMENPFIPTQKIKVAVAKDSAFCFTYRENIARLNQIGNITYFSPMHSYELPDADLIYLPGGYIELFARQLHRKKNILNAIKEYAEKGGRILAEGGGTTYLGRTLTAREGGTAYAMCNILPIDSMTQSNNRPTAGYRKSDFPFSEWKGFEFQYTSVYKEHQFIPTAMPSITNLKGTEALQHWYRYKNVIASHTHWYWGDKDIMKLWE